MITNKEKEQIHKELLPFWLFYNVEHEVNDLAYAELVTNFKDTESYKICIKRFIRINETLFFKHIFLLDRGAFIVEINDQFNNYNIRCLDMNDWLKSTYKLIVNGLPSSKINLQSKSEFLEWYKIKIDLLEKTKLISSNNEPNAIDLSNTNSDFNLNHFNAVTYNLFKYLIGNYEKNGKVKYLNIYKYLKEINKDSYAFNFNQKTYKEYIFNNYDVRITTFNTANYGYEDIEKPILNGFEQAFRNIKP